MANEVNVVSTTNLGGWNNWAVSEVGADYSKAMIEFDDYSKQCAMDAMSAIYQLIVSTENVSTEILSTPQFRDNLRNVVKRCASLKLSANAHPREVYFQIRNKKIGNEWTKEIEMGIEGDGNDALLRNFGVDVQKVGSPWMVMEGDDFEYPKRKGFDIAPPEWNPKGLSNKVVRVVYPIKLKGKGEEYLIAERESVRVNLMAHVRNNLMNETFGICESRYKANAEQKAKINEQKDLILNALRECETVDDMLKCEIARPYISAAWLDSPESMIIRKMRNNAIRRYPKSLNSIANASINELDDTYKASQEEIEMKENSEPFAIEGEVE